MERPLFSELPLVSIVIVTHNRKKHLVRLIRSILYSKYPSDKMEIIVIDDNSSDGTFSLVRRIFPQIKIIRNNKEKLLAESRNIGIRNSCGDYIFIIDDDNIVDSDTIWNLVTFMESHPSVGVAGPKMYYLKDSQRIWCAGVKINYYNTITKFIGRDTIDDGTFDKIIESDAFPNAFIVPRKVIEKVGMLNSKLFPIHYDEGDFCNRVKQAGYRVMLVPSAKVWHDVPFTKEKFKMRLRNPMRAYYTIRNRFFFHRIWSKNILQHVFSTFFSLFISIYYLIMVLVDNPQEKNCVIKAALKGLFDGILLKWR